MPRYKHGPIERFSWGRFVICGKEHSENGGQILGAGKDIRVIGKDVTEWKEREGHRLAPAMITGVYDQRIDVLVIGLGVEKALRCPGKVKKSIRKHGIDKVILRSTPKACREYNRLLRKGKRVALLAHGTC